MTKQADNADQFQVLPGYGVMVSTIFKIGRYGFLPMAIAASILLAIGECPWYVPATFAFGVVYIEFLRRWFLQKIPFYWPTKEQ